MNDADAEKLQKAAAEGDLRTVERLIAMVDRKCDRKALDAALRQADFWNRHEIMDRFLAAGANPELKTIAGTLLMGAAMNGNLPMVKRLIKAGANVHREVKGETALSAALSENQKHVVKYLESLGASSPPTPSLLYASMHGDIKRMERALADGADLNKKGGVLEETPLLAAARNGHVAAVRLLFKHGANPNAKVLGRPALFDGVEHGKTPDVLEAFLEAGADIRSKDYDETLLMAAARGGSLAIVKRLVELGADVNHRDKNFDKTALDEAKAGKHKEVIDYLRSLGAKADRDPGRALVRALAREFGGKPIEHSHGFMLNSKLAAYGCQFHVYSDACAVVVFRLRFHDAELRALRDASVLFSPKKPKSEHRKIEEVKLPTPIPGLKTYRSGSNSVSTKFAAAFARRHHNAISQLKLSGHDAIEVGPRAMRFHWQGTAPDAILARVKAFARFIERVCQKLQPERQLFAGELFLKRAKKSTVATASRHSFGGHLEELVACPQCDYATNVMAQIDLSDPALPKTPLDRRKLPILWCLSCLPWEPSFYDISGRVPKALDDKGKPLNRKKLTQGEDDLDLRPVTLVPVPREKKAGRKSKIGGAPTWIQMEETPDCPKCRGAMTFVMQLDSEPCMYGDMGLLYTFACPSCKVMASLVQSH
jgi:ankyrin repeat protein